MAAKALAERFRQARKEEPAAEVEPSGEQIVKPERTERRERIQDLQRDEIFDVLPEVYPKYYSFGLLSAADMRLIAGDIIILHATVKKGVCPLGSLEDPRMGPIEPGVRCATCSQTVKDCPGHQGFMPFPIPMINPHPDVVRNLVRILNIVCDSCSQPKVDRKELEAKKIMNIMGEMRIKIIEKLVKDRTCRRERSPDDPKNIAPCTNRIYLTQSKDENNKDLSDDIYYKASKRDRPIHAKVEELYNILDKISDDTADLLGFEAGVHPRNMILRGLLVIPPAARPPNPSEHRIAPHDLTKKYQDILKDIAKINILRNTNKVDTEEYNNTVRKMRNDIKILIGISEQSSGKKVSTRSIKKTIQGKQGLIMRNLQGKRTNNSARTVFSLDPNLRIGQIGIPKMLARKLTVREPVTPDNVEQLQQMLQN